jgi:hypothetical protein
MDSSLLKAEHVHVLSPRARFRGNDGHGITVKAKLVSWFELARCAYQKFQG